MKKEFLILFMLLAGVSLKAQFNSAQLQASGLTCALCTKAINNSLSRLSFVQSVEPDIKNSAFKISFRNGAALKIDALKKAVEEAGFSVASLKLTGKFSRLAVKNDEHVEIGGELFHFLKVNDQLLNGEKEIRIVDKAFLPTKEFKKYSAATTMTCVQTGKMESCCSKQGAQQPARRIYHVTI
ncbi:MAG: heavy-metal-associated domain-containing protein [Williamsia sp.]|nr:heavy-metal-associated domain-containing protein [Williamsia sp.]